MSSSREIKQLQKAKSKAQANRNLKEEANICNQLGELLSRTGDYEGAIREHQQELALSEALNDVIGRAVANRKIGECYAETGKIEAALKHQRCHLDLARSVGDHAEEQRALATIGRTFLFRYESDQSKSSLKQAEDAFRKSLAVVDERLGGTVPEREIREMKARLFLNLGLVCDHLGEPKRCSEFIRRSVFIAEKSQLLEDLYRANFNLGNIFFRNGEPSSAVRCLEQAKDCARKMKDKFSESECFHCIGKVQLYLGDFVAARRSLKKALLLGSQQPADKMAVKKAFKYADKGCKLEEELSEDQGSRPSSRQVVELTEQLGDLCCKVGCYSKALDAYRAQLTAAEALGKSDLELAVIHVSLAATHTDLRQHRQAVEHYRKELALRHGSASEECSTWLNLFPFLQGETPMDTLRHWQRTYRKELDEEARQECLCTEKLLRKAAAGGVPAAPAAAKPFDALQDSQLFDAENSEPLLATRGRSLSNQDRSSPRQRPSSGTSKQHRARGTEGSVIYGTSSSSSDSSDSDSPVSPLRPVRPRHAVPAAPSQKENPSAQEPLRTESTREAPAPCVFQRDEYHSAIRSLGSAKTLRQALSQPQFSSTPTVSSALVPEDEYLADDWLEDDLGEMQPKKKRRLRIDFNEPRREEAASSLARSQNHLSAESSCRGAVSISSSRGLSQRKNGSLKPHQVKVTQMPGMVRLGTREVSRSNSPSVPDDEDMRPEAPPLVHFQPLAPAAPIPASLPPPIRMRVKVQEDVFLIPVPQSEADSCTVSWLCEQAAQRYYQKCGLLPRLSLQKEGALLSPQDLLLAVLHTNEEVLAEVCSWDLPPLPDRYRKACQSLAVDEDRRVSRLCEVQDGGQSVSLCGLSLAPASLNPLLRALKLQASLTELRLSGNRLHDDLLPELVATTTTMPRLRLLDVSANGITGEGLEKAVEALKGQSHPAYAYLEELDLSLNPLGDGVVESLSCLLSSCPLLSRLSLQACRLTARFLQQHRLLLAAALTGLSHLKSVSLSHNALGSTGFELVLKTLPLQTLTHLDLAAVHRGPADHLALQHLAKLLSQGECPLTHLSLAGNGLMDSSVTILARCLPSCPTLTSLDLSGNPSVSWSGLHSILTSVREASRPLTFLNLQGCQVSGPWSSEELDGLSELVQDLRLCSQGLNKLDRDALRHSWGLQDGRCVNRNARFLLSAAAASS
ncbi:tonsoku-like protein [Poecilia latipinna]|uniref:tonsoku-like protein n=1 Tax=Poecilia latipinna TaxID=48699 RepID=UPI00072EE7E4|nr:PREDICTED: tonsoku-like protein [Poecilia latipinna]